MLGIEQGLKMRLQRATIDRCPRKAESNDKRSKSVRSGSGKTGRSELKETQEMRSESGRRGGFPSPEEEVRTRG